jgi:thymidylate synthase (FAD)
LQQLEQQKQKLMNETSNRIDCLDHGYVRLVDHMGSDLSIVRAARVSYSGSWRAGADEGSDKRLIKYLWAHSHTSPFEAVTFTFEAKAPIFILRQWHRHRTWSYNELSARYRELPSEFYVPAPDVIGVQSAVNKQARDLSVAGTSAESEESARIIADACALAFHRYRELLERGVPRELARSVLPVATYSHMFATVNLLNLFRFLSLRCDPHAQYEIRVYAEAMLSLIEPIVPVCVSAWRAEAEK